MVSDYIQFLDKSFFIILFFIPYADAVSFLACSLFIIPIFANWTKWCSSVSNHSSSSIDLIGTMSLVNCAAPQIGHQVTSFFVLKLNL